MYLNVLLTYSKIPKTLGICGFCIILIQSRKQSKHDTILEELFFFFLNKRENRFISRIS